MDKQKGFDIVQKAKTKRIIAKPVNLTDKEAFELYNAMMKAGSKFINKLTKRKAA